MPHAQMPIRRMSKKITSECKQYATFLLTMYLYCKNLEIDTGPARVPLLSLDQEKLDAYDKHVSHYCPLVKKNLMRMIVHNLQSSAKNLESLAWPKFDIRSVLAEIQDTRK